MLKKTQVMYWEKPLADSTTKQLVAMIAVQLGETRDAPVGQIYRIVQRLGNAAALACLEETKQIEAQGGMFVADGSRRRTPGGVYFRLIMSRISTQDRMFIFPKNWKKRKRAQHGISETHPPSRLRADANDLPQLDGKVRIVKITLVGRPGPITVIHDGCVMTTMQNATPPSFPKGIPTPPRLPVSFTVYIAPKQWNKVADALTNPEDMLIVEGWPTYDPVRQAITVYVLNTTTRELQRQRRAQQES
jgi:hypothetical protein